MYLTYVSAIYIQFYAKSSEYNMILPKYNMILALMLYLSFVHIAYMVKTTRKYQLEEFMQDGH